MLYKLTNIKIEKIADSKMDAVRRVNPNASGFYVRATVENPNDVFDEPSVQVFLNEAITNKMRSYFAVANNGTAPADTPMPEEMTTFKNGQYEQFIFPETMVQVDDEGQPIRNSKGNMRVRQSITVLCKYVIDNETGERRYARGWSPEERASSIMANFYAPLSRFNVGPINAPAPLINGQTAPAPGAPAPAVGTVPPAPVG